MTRQTKHFFEFGDFRLDPQAHRLMRDGVSVPLPPKAMEALLVLVERGGDLMKREELLQAVWGDSFVEDANLTVAVSQLRKALGQNGEPPEYIETIPRIGYCFVAEVRDVTEEAAPLIIEKRMLSRTLIEEELLDDKSQAGAVATAGDEARVIDSLAVLPFANMSANPDLEYLSDGITENIINNLSQIAQLRVVASSTVFRFKGLEVDALELGRELRVGALLSGRVLLFNDRLVIRAGLVDAMDGWQLWGAQYNRAPADIFAVQEEIAREISDNLQLKLTGREQKLLAKRHTESAEAYHAYLKGRYYENKRTEEGLKQGIEFFQQAIDLDPCYALAYSGLADCYAVLGTFGGLEPKSAFPKAKAAAQKALEIDDALAEAHTSLAFVKQLYDWDWSGAEKEYARAIELNPSYATVHFWRATLFAALGRCGEAIAEIEQALELDPLSLPINTYMGWALSFARRYDEAVKQCRQTLELDKNFVQALWRLGLAYAQEGMYEEAVAELEKGLKLSADNTLILGALGYAYAASGKRGDAEKVLGELKKLSERRYVSAYQVATVHTGLGDVEEALRWLERACGERAGLMIYLNVEPVFDALRSDPRFADLARRVGFQAT